MSDGRAAREEEVLIYGIVSRAKGKSAAPLW